MFYLNKVNSLHLVLMKLEGVNTHVLAHEWPQLDVSWIIDTVIQQIFASMSSDEWNPVKLNSKGLLHPQFNLGYVHICGPVLQKMF